MGFNLEEWLHLQRFYTLAAQIGALNYFLQPRIDRCIQNAARLGSFEPLFCGKLIKTEVFESALQGRLLVFGLYSLPFNTPLG